MHNHFLEHSSDLRRAWKQLRDNLTSNITDDDQISMVLTWWSKAPLGKPYLDYLQPTVWPDAWSLIDSRDFDDATKTLGIFYTLLLGADQRWDKTRMQLAVLRSRERSHENLSLILDNILVVNFWQDSVDNLAILDDIIILHRYNYDAATKQFVEIKIHRF